MSGVNRVYMVGRVIVAPTPARLVKGGTPITKFTVAVESHHATTKRVYNASCVMMGRGVKNTCKVLKPRTLLHLDGVIQHSEIDGTTEIFVHSFTILQWASDAPPEINNNYDEDVVDYD